MTGYTVHTGTSKKFVNGWDRVFADSPQKAGKKTRPKPKKKKKPKSDS